MKSRISRDQSEDDTDHFGVNPWGFDLVAVDGGRVDQVPACREAGLALEDWRARQRVGVVLTVNTGVVVIKRWLPTHERGTEVNPVR